MPSARCGLGVVAASVLSISVLGCAWSADPAVRLARCLEDAIEEHPGGDAAIHASCDLEMPGSYLVVLHPTGALPDEQLVSAGLPQALLPEFKELRIGEQPGIFVIATDPGISGIGSERSTLSSWTTSQMHFVQIDSLMVLAKNTQPVAVDVGGPAARRVIEGLD